MTWPSYDPETRDLVDSVVLFADVATATSIMAAASPGPSLSTLYDVLERAREDSNIDDAQDVLSVSWYTDKLSMAFPLTTPDSLEAQLGELLRVAGNFQARLTNERIFVRGGITRGHFYHSNQFHFGPAHVEAVELENTTTQPRIALSTNVVDLIGTSPHTDSFTDDLCVDPDDGTVFINYLNAEWTCYTTAVAAHETMVRDELAKGHPPSLHAKYNWLLRYQHGTDKLTGPPPNTSTHWA